MYSIYVCMYWIFNQIPTKVGALRKTECIVWFETLINPYLIPNRTQSTYQMLKQTCGIWSTRLRRKWYPLEGSTIRNQLVPPNLRIIKLRGKNQHRTPTDLGTDLAQGWGQTGKNVNALNLTRDARLRSCHFGEENITDRKMSDPVYFASNSSRKPQARKGTNLKSPQKMWILPPYTPYSVAVG